MKVFYKIAIIIFLFLAGQVCSTYIFAQSENKVTVLDIRNPFSIELLLEVKCDVIPGTSKYRYYNKFVVPGKRKFVLRVPSNLRYCECWPLDFKMFGKFK